MDTIYKMKFSLYWDIGEKDKSHPFLHARQNQKIDATIDHAGFSALPKKLSLQKASRNCIEKR